MEKKYKLFNKTIQKLSEAGVLLDLILIGSWCLHFYRILFEDADTIPAIRTVDIDFLVPNPPRIKHKADVPRLLEELGFMEEFSHITGNSKYIHPDLEVEFIIPEKGRGKDGPYRIKEINISAQGLRYVSLLQDHVIRVAYEGIMINIPEPAAFTLHKLQISKSRNKKDKKIKDLETAISLGEYLVTRKDQVNKMKKIFKMLPVKWKKDILGIVREKSGVLYEILIAD